MTRRFFFTRLAQAAVATAATLSFPASVFAYAPDFGQRGIQSYMTKHYNIWARKVRGTGGSLNTLELHVGKNFYDLFLSKLTPCTRCLDEKSETFQVGKALTFKTARMIHTGQPGWRVEFRRNGVTEYTC